jgi:hypothetical protein
LTFFGTILDIRGTNQVHSHQRKKRPGPGGAHIGTSYFVQGAGDSKGDCQSSAPRCFTYQLSLARHPRDGGWRISAGLRLAAPADGVTHRKLRRGTPSKLHGDPTVLAPAHCISKACCSGYVKYYPWIPIAPAHAGSIRIQQTTRSGIACPLWAASFVRPVFSIPTPKEKAMHASRLPPHVQDLVHQHRLRAGKSDQAAYEALIKLGLGMSGGSSAAATTAAVAAAAAVMSSPLGDLNEKQMSEMKLPLTGPLRAHASCRSGTVGRNAGWRHWPLPPASRRSVPMSRPSTRQSRPIRTTEMPEHPEREKRRT